MSQFTIYRSSDGSAPALSGASGSLVALLDAILVNGYGSKAAAGWTKPYLSGVTGADYKAGGGNGFYLQVDDSGPGVGSFAEARCRGYESMSAWNTETVAGVGLFPTTAQAANGLFIRKSAAVSGTARTWIAFADNRTVYLFVLTGDVAGVYMCFGFGDFYSYAGASDAFRSMLMARTTENSAAQTVESLLFATTAPAGGASAGNYVARGFVGTGGALNTGKQFDPVGGTSPGAGALQYPNGADGGLYLSPLNIFETAGPTMRGRMRGLYFPAHAVASFSDGDTLSGAGDYAGKTFTLLKTVTTNNTPTNGVVAVETSNTLDTN